MNRLIPLVVLSFLAVSAGAQMGGGPCIMTELHKLCPQSDGSAEYKECAKKSVPQAMSACRGDSAARAGKSLDEVKAKSPCADDMKKYCPGIWPGPELHECMSKHKSELSSACAAFGEKMAKEHAHDKPMDAGDMACVADGKKFCPGLSGTDGQKFMDCLVEHEADLSAACKARFGKHKGAGKGLECGAALKKFCPDAAIGSAEMAACMMEHRDELPPACGKRKKK